MQPPYIFFDNARWQKIDRVVDRETQNLFGMLFANDPSRFLPFSVFLSATCSWRLA